jgi:hypothetical protein
MGMIPVGTKAPITDERTIEEGQKTNEDENEQS